MPITSKGFARSSLAFLVVGLLALIGIVGTTIWLVERTQVYFEDVIEAREARRAAVNLFDVLQDAELGQRGYIITLDEAYLEPYENAIGRVMPSFERLSEVLAPYPQAEEPLAQMREGLLFKLDEMAETITLTRNEQRGDAVAIIRTDEGKRVMDDARVLLTAVMDAADSRTYEGVIDQRSAATALRIVTIAGALIILIVVGGAIWTVLLYTRDIQRARDEVRMLNAGLEMRVAARTVELQRANEEVQRFAYIVTHDLRAPLVNIMGFTSELDASLPPIQALVDADLQGVDENIVNDARQAAAEDLPEAIGFIRSSTRRMDGLINAILKISREGQRQLRPEAIALDQMVEASVASLRHQIDDNGGEFIMQGQAPALYSDKLAIEQIVGNLLDNAIKYRHGSRPLSITVRTGRALNGRVFLEVEDNGRGIAPEDHERVFELFRRSGTQDQPGEGIGLAHVRIMARNLGGDITVHSTAGEGTTFRVELAPDLRDVARSKEQ